MGHILITNIHGNPNVGLFGFATDEYCLIGKFMPKNIVNKIEKVLNVPVHQLQVCGTDLVGVFCAGNSNCLLLPEIIYDEELKEIEKLKINYKIINTKLTALGNNILCNDNGCLVNPNFSAEVKKRIREALKVPLKPGTIGELNIVGSCAAINKKGGLIHNDVKRTELKYAEDLLKIKFTNGSLNMANPFVKSAIICNSHGFVVGDASGGPEITNADEALGFLDQ